MSTKLYLVVVEDRHTDPAYTLFTSADAAIEFAKGEAAGLSEGDDDDDIGEERIDGWLYAYRCSGEGDYVHVEAVEVDPPEEGE